MKSTTEMHPVTLVLTILACSKTALGFLSQSHLSSDELVSLLNGFAPLIGLCVLLVTISLLISFVICTVERTLTDEDDGIVPEPHLKSKWQLVVHYLPDQLADRLSLNEHSPPVI